MLSEVRDEVAQESQQSCFFGGGKESVGIEVSFRNFHGFNLAYHVGTPITLSGNTSERNGRVVLTKVTELKSLFGNSESGKAKAWARKAEKENTPLANLWTTMLQDAGVKIDGFADANATASSIWG